MSYENKLLYQHISETCLLTWYICSRPLYTHLSLSLSLSLCIYIYMYIYILIYIICIYICIERERERERERKRGVRGLTLISFFKNYVIPLFIKLCQLCFTYNTVSLKSLNIILPGKGDSQEFGPPDLWSQGEEEEGKEGRKQGRKEGRKEGDWSSSIVALGLLLYRCMLRKLWQRGRWVSAPIAYTHSPHPSLFLYSPFTLTCMD